MPLFALTFFIGCDDPADGSDDPLVERTLESCGGSADSEVPDFYQDFFACVIMTESGGDVTLASNGLPPHPSPYYDTDSENWVAFDERDGQWFQNPNVIASQDHSVTIAAEPVAKGLTIDDSLVDLSAGTSDEEYTGGLVGLAIDGVALFHATAAPGDSIEDEKYTFDLYEGHPEQSGTYHHHSANPAALAVLKDRGYTTTTAPGEAELELFGIMCDGTVVLGCTELDGSEAPSDGLDSQAGHVHDMTGPEGELYFTNRYHTHVCDGLHTHQFTPEIQYYEGCG